MSDSTGSQPLPHSEESERAVLASVIMAPRLIGELADRLQVSDFHLGRHRIIYRAMLALRRADTEIDLRTLQAALEQTGRLDQVGGMAYLAGLDLDLPDLNRIDAYVEILKERSIRRRILLRGARILEQSWDGGGLDAEAAVEKLQELVHELGGHLHTKGLVSLHDAYDELLDAEAQPGGGLLGIPTGFLQLDFELQGWVAGNLVIVAGRPGMGKTAFAVGTAANAALREGRSVAVFSLEMTLSEIRNRIVSSETGIPHEHIRARTMRPEEWRSVWEAWKESEGVPIWIDDTARPTMGEIAAKCRLHKARHGLDLVVIDHLHKFPIDENRASGYDRIVDGCKALAKELEVAVILCAQLNRGGLQRASNRPRLEDLKWAGAIEEHADTVLFPYREEYYDRDKPELRGRASLLVAKNRHGECRDVEVRFDGERIRFLDAEVWE